MHKYERFIIYPLLIVALFYGFAGEQMGTTAQEVIDELMVKDISVVNDDYEKVVSIGSIDMYGGSQGQIIVSAVPTPEFRHETEITSSRISNRSRGIKAEIKETGFTISETMKEEAQKKSSDELEIPTIFLNVGVNSLDPESYLAREKLYGQINTYNKNGDNLVSIGLSNNRHGGIWVYDRYGEYPQYYGHTRY